MDSAPQITVPIKPGLNRLLLNENALRPGSILKLKVLELSGNRALIDFGNFRTAADVKIPVTVGEELLVKVQEFGSRLKLGLLRSDPKSGSGDEMAATRPPTAGIEARSIVQADLKQLLVQLVGSDTAKMLPGQLQHALDVLNGYFESIDLEKRIAEMLPRLKSHVNNSGLFFEKMLETAILKIIHRPDTAPLQQLSRHPDVQAVLGRDLKANLYLLKNFAADAASDQRAFDSRALTVLHKSIDFLLNDLALQQGRAVRLSDSAEPFQYFSFALPLGEDRHPAKLKIYYPKKQKHGSRQGFQVSLLLSLDRLGELRTDFYLLGQDLSLTFFVKSRKARAKILQYQQDLQQLLNPLFNQTILQVVVAEKKITDFEQEDIQIAADRRVDLRI